MSGAVAAISARWARTVFTSPRTIGPVRAASPSVSALSSAASSSGRRIAAGSSAPAALEQLHRLGDQGDEVVGAVRQARVVEAAVLLGHPHHVAAEVGDDLLGPGALRRAGGHAEDAVGAAGRGRGRCR